MQKMITRSLLTTVSRPSVLGALSASTPVIRRTMAYVYAGPGASTKGVNAIMSLIQSSKASNNNTFTGIKKLGLEDILPRNKIAIADGTGILPTHWTEDGALIIMPGGKSFTHFLNPAQIETIRDFVFQGGSYLGICAGAYFGSTRCFFGGEEVASPAQRLRLFPGDAVGSITPKPYDPLSEKGAASVEVVFSPAFVARCEAAGELTPNKKPLHVAYSPVPAFSPVSLDVYANGGCCFLNPRRNNNNHIISSNDSEHYPHPDYEVLAIYGDDQGLRQDAEGRAAIVACDYGKGKVVLSGVHPEFTAQDAKFGAQAFHCTDGASSLLEIDDRYRAALFRSLLREAGTQYGSDEMN